MIAFLFSFFLCLNASSQIIEKVQIQVGEEMISLLDLKAFQKQLRLRLVPSSLLFTRTYKKSQALDFMLNRFLLSQLAKKELLPAPSKKQIESLLKKLRGKLSHKAFAKKLQSAGLTLKELRKQIQTALTNDFFLSQFVIPKIIVSEKDIESYYFNKYHRPLFNTFEYEFVSVSFAENKKEAFLKKLKNKKSNDLEDMARSLNLDYKILTLKEKDIQTQLKKELIKLSVSQISPLFFLANQYYVLQLKWKYPKINQSEKKKKEKIEKLIYKQKVNQEISQWIEEKKTTFFIVRHPL